MGLLSGTVSVTRFNVVIPPEGPDFERARFWAIDPGSDVRERMGFIPFEIDSSWEVSSRAGPFACGSIPSGRTPRRSRNGSRS